MPIVKIKDLPVAKLTEEDKVIGVLLAKPETRRVSITGSYQVVLIQADSDHIMAKHVEDEEELMVYSEMTDMWYEAAEFFHTISINRFISL